MRLRPSRFNVRCRNFRIKYVRDTSNLDGNLGVIDCERGEVMIAERHDGKSLPQDSIDETIAHELVHCATWAAGYESLSDDEMFVDRMAVVILQILKSLK